MFIQKLYKRQEELTMAPDGQFRQLGRVFEHSFSLRAQEFEQSNLQKFKCPGFLGGGGDVEVLS